MAVKFPQWSTDADKKKAIAIVKDQIAANNKEFLRISPNAKKDPQVRHDVIVLMSQNSVLKGFLEGLTYAKAKEIESL